MAYAVAYRSGGTHNCTWTRIADSFPTLASVFAKKMELERAGYHSIHDENGFPHGLPIGWSPGNVAWAVDDVKIVRAKNGTMLQTIHQKKADNGPTNDL